jgi:hypothetical protein
MVQYCGITIAGARTTVGTLPGGGWIETSSSSAKLR